ncbi:hypothetical protein JHK84_056359 [Glycine max]|nr:hypothetical protein JHK84_056359 [Glycine max]
MPSLSLSDPDTPKPSAKKKTKTQSLTDPDLDGVSGKKTKKRKASDLEQEAMPPAAYNNDGDDETSSDLVQPEPASREDDNKNKKKKKKKVVKSEEKEQPLVTEANGEKKEDPNALSNFRISEPLRQKLKEKGIESLFPIQAMTFDTVLDGSDLVGRARTGQGKTLAFVLPILESLINGPTKASRKTGFGRTPSVLVLLPTRELACQVHADFDVYGGAMGLSSCCLYGGAPYQGQEIKLRRGVDIVIGTPGRVKDHIEKGNIDLSQLKFRVLDEADEMLRMGFVEDVEMILGKVENVNKVQTLLFSATLPDWVKQIAARFLKPDKKTADLVGNTKMKASINVRHIVLPCTSSARAQLIPDIIRCYSSGGRTIVFTETKESASQLAGILTGAKALHGDIQQSTREVTLSGFRSGKFMTLVATNVAARGLDINDVQLIIQCEPPRDVEAYIHRSGRTGRAGNTGVAVMLYDPKRSNISRIERESGVKFEHVSAPQPDDIAKAVSGEAAEMIIQVSDSVVPAFKSAAEDLLNNSGLPVIELLAKALAKAVGYTEVKQRSLLTSMENYVTLLLETGKPIYTQSFAYGVLRRFLPEEKVEAVKGLSITADGNGVVFDVAAKDLDIYLNGQENASNVSLEIVKTLPQLQQMEQHQRGGRFGDGGGRGYRFGGRGGGGRNGRFSNGGGRGGRGGNWGGKRCRYFDKKRRYHPVAGTVMHQMFNFHRLLDYMIDRTNQRKTYRLLSFIRTEVYTANPVNFEYILTTNFANYGKDLFMKATLDSVCKVVLGVELDTVCGTYKQGTEFSNAFDEVSAAIMYRYFKFLWRIIRFLNIGSEVVLNKSLRVIDEFVYELIRTKIEQAQKLQDNSPVRTRKDTISVTLSWFLYELCKNPHVQEKIAQEIRQTTNVEAGSTIDELAARVTEENMEKMQYLNAALNETLRLHPAVPVEGKFCFSDDTWPDGYSVRKGDHVSFKPYFMGRMKRDGQMKMEF